MLNYTKLNPEECEFLAVASVEDLPNGERMFVEIDGDQIVVFNIGGSFFAIGDVCSHDNGPLGDGDLEETYEIVCPRHGARFDVRNGEVRSYPAVENIPAFPVRVNEEGEIELGLPL